ncbi:MAG: T9SS type A sorting domain-containing protein [Saprospiraceae bacterium]|nr:T9SS type A sorting domain-containing protein [Saprospiraceae bacterium]
MINSKQLSTRKPGISIAHLVLLILSFSFFSAVDPIGSIVSWEGNAKFYPGTSSAIEFTSHSPDTSYRSIYYDHRGVASAPISTDTCTDPLLLPWISNLINNPFNPYCSECLRLYQAKWNGNDVFIYEWDAGSCGFSDLGFTTIYTCSGDTIQHCYLSIAGLTCDPDSMIKDDNLEDKELIWQCEPTNFPNCPSDPDILAMTWLNDTLEKFMDLCDVFCIEGNSGNYVYKHMVDTNVILELRTTCGDIVRRFFDCAGNIIYTCTSFGFASPADCDLPFLPALDDGEILWTCPTTSSRAITSNSETFKVFPTFITDQITLITETARNWEMTIFNNLGQIIKKVKGRSETEIIPTADWPGGTLFLKIRSHDATEVIKVVKVD